MKSSLYFGHSFSISFSLFFFRLIPFPPGTLYHSHPLPPLKGSTFCVHPLSLSPSFLNLHLSFTRTPYHPPLPMHTGPTCQLDAQSEMASLGLERGQVQRGKHLGERRAKQRSKFGRAERCRLGASVGCLCEAAGRARGGQGSRSDCLRAHGVAAGTSAIDASTSPTLGRSLWSGKNGGQQRQRVQR